MFYFVLLWLIQMRIGAWILSHCVLEASRALRFHDGSFSQAVTRARQDLKLLVVYLHSALALGILLCKLYIYILIYNDMYNTHICKPYIYIFLSLIHIIYTPYSIQLLSKWPPRRTCEARGTRLQQRLGQRGHPRRFGRSSPRSYSCRPSRRGRI